ncbi:MAG: hypothetical protein WCL51_06065 [Bacteroidota bacterium]
MNNYSTQNGRRLIDSYRGGAEKLYELCDYINKKAMNWYALNIEFSPIEVELITKVQQAMDDMKDILKKVAEAEDKYDCLDLGYEVYPTKCNDCNGDVKVTRHLFCPQGYSYNIYKCIECGNLFEEHQPNNYKDCISYFVYYYQLFNDALASEIHNEKNKDRVRENLIKLKEKEKVMMAYFEKVLIEREPLKEAVMISIKANGEIYKELIKQKHHFDKNRSEA